MALGKGHPFLVVDVKWVPRPPEKGNNTRRFTGLVPRGFPQMSVSQTKAELGALRRLQPHCPKLRVAIRLGRWRRMPQAGVWRIGSGSLVLLAALPQHKDH